MCSKCMATLSSLVLLIFFLKNPLHAQCTNDAHSTNAFDAWLSCQLSANPNVVRGNSHWVMYDLGYNYILGATTIWNYNVENETEKGFKNVVVDYSLDGMTWMEAGQFQVPQANGSNSYTGFNGFDLGGVEARYVLLTAVDTWSSGDCAGISELKIEVGGLPLPLELLNFSAKAKEDFISLNWESLDEQDFSHYEIERSTDATEFHFIGKVLGNNNATVNQYQLNDFDIRSGQLYYYRLKMMDLDKTFEYSPVRTAQTKSDLSLTIFPNPTSHILNISFETELVKEIIIQNATGHELLRIKTSQMTHQIDTSAFPAGIYLCQIVGSHSTIATRRFVKVD